VIDPYQCWAPRSINGVYLSGWQFQDRMVMQRHFVPRRRGRRLSRRHGGSPELSDVYGRPSTPGLLALREQLLRAPARSADAACELLADDDFDLVWINFSAAHKAGHHFWDPASVLEDEPSAGDLRALETALEEVYAEVDAALGRVIEALPEEADLIVFSPIGMGPNTSRADLLPDMVAAVLGGPERSNGAVNGGGVKTPVWSLRERIPVSWRRLAARALPDRLVADLTTRLYVRGDWERTRAMAIPGECHGYVRLNLAGRERDGIVDPAAADTLKREIAEGLMSFRDPDGLPLIAEVERTEELAGEASCARELPDLVIRWVDRPASGVGTLSSPQFGEVNASGVGSGRSGHHNDDAWALIISGDARPADQDRAANLTDLGATACAVLEADSDGLTGRTLIESRTPAR
jgi:predicted AlkP superfamily phosphohydrolase/phosphomutase